MRHSETWSFGAFLSYLSIFLAFTSNDCFARHDRAVFPAARNIIVVGDLHGDVSQLIKVLQLAEIIDSERRWIGRDSQLVQLGDLPDRGPDTLEIIDFLQRLEKGARRNGGYVHVLIGNHDAMNVYGDLRYVTNDEYTAFATPKSEKLLNRLFMEEVKWIKDNNPKVDWPDFESDFKEKWFAARPPGYVEHRTQWLPKGKIGRWIVKHNTVLKIGDTLFVHGGISQRYADSNIADINRMVRDAFKDVENIEGTILRQEDGPLWYRGLAQNSSPEEFELLESIRANFEIDRIILGHTPTGGIILPRLGGKVILADVGLAHHYGANLACLQIQEGQAFALYPEGKIPLPATMDEAAMNEYLETLAQIKESDSRIQQRIQSILSKP